MSIKYPQGPIPELVGKDTLRPGEGINITVLDADEYLDFCTPPGLCSGMIFKTIAQLAKWGFDAVKIDESIEVSPISAQYYQLTMRQKEELEHRIKTGLASISTAISDLDLVSHDLRKYKEYMDYFAKIARGKELKKKDDPEGEKLVMEGQQTLKMIFIDEVDVHTGEAVALKLIARRWPTIVSDFLKLTDDDKDPKSIAEKYNVPEAEGVVLGTKNKLYMEWRDRLFEPTVKQRFKSLFEVVESRRKSVDEYKKMLKPVIARHMGIKEKLQEPAKLQRISFWMPESQAISIDSVKIWAWKPFAPTEKYRIARETFDRIPAEKAGFRQSEIAELRRDLGKDWDGMVDGLPQDTWLHPSIDSVVRKYADAIAKEYGVKITAVDLYNARDMLFEKFKESLAGHGIWMFSPYFIFFEIPLDRLMIRLPNGVEVEDLMMDKVSGAVQTQNMIILHYLEIIAKGKQIEQHISQMLGEAGVRESEVIPLEELMKMEYSEIFGKVEKIPEKTSAFENIKDTAENLRAGLGDMLNFFGIDITVLRARGPYEFSFQDRITKHYLIIAGHEFHVLVNFLKAGFNVPGISV